MIQVSDFLSKVSDDAIFATITALFVVLLSGFSKWVYDKTKQAIARRDLRTYFLHYLKSLLESIDKRIQSLKTVANLSNIQTKDFVFTENVVRSEHITQLPYTELFAALVRGFPRKKKARLIAYNELMAALDFLTHQLPIVKAQFGYFFENSNTYRASWNQSANTVIQLHREYLAYDHENNIRASADPFLFEINKIYNNWTKISNKDDTEVVNANMLEPIKAVCVKYQKDRRRVILLYHILEAETAHLNRKRTLELAADYFTEQTEATVARKKTVERSIAVLS